MKAYDVVLISCFCIATALIFLCFLCQKKRSTLPPSSDVEKGQNPKNTTATTDGGIFIFAGAAAMATMSTGCGGGGCGGGGCGGGGCGGGC